MKINKRHISPSEDRRRKRQNLMKRQLRKEDKQLSQEMLELEQSGGSIGFENLFKDNEDCERKLVDFQGWKETHNSNHVGGILLKFQCQKKIKKSVCSSDAAIKIIRIDTLILSKSDNEKKFRSNKPRIVYQCLKCGSQFNVYRDTIFSNRKGSDLWAWFLCLYAMYQFNGKIPITWLVYKYTRFLVEQEQITFSNNEEKNAFDRKIVERIRKITRKIKVDLFGEETTTEDFFKYRELFFPKNESNNLDFHQWNRVNKKPFKVSLVTKEYSYTKSGAREYVEKFHETKLFRVQNFRVKDSCEMGDWIIQIKNKSEEDATYKFRWMHVDDVLDCRSGSSGSRWKAVQLKKNPIYHYRPFALDENFKKAFKEILDKYADENEEYLPPDEVISCPPLMFEALVNKIEKMI